MVFATCKYKLALVLLASVLLCAACTYKKASSGNMSEYQSAAVPEQMAFINFKIKPDTVIKLDLRVVDGSFKQEPEERNDLATIPLLEYTLRDSAQQLIAKISMPHPLHKRVEYQDDRGVFQSKMLDLKEAEFFIRISYTANIRYIDFAEKIQGQWKHLSMLKL